MSETPRTKRVFISDVHLGMNEPWDWYQPVRHEPPLLRLLEYVADPASGVKDFVLNGDLFETWMCPIDRDPPTMAEILARHPAVIAGIRAIAKAGVDVFYMPGNHDMGVTAKDLEVELPEVKVIKNYRSGLLYAEHGSRFAMFNAPDHLHDPADGLPLGYFITRLLAGTRDYTKPRAVFGYIDDLLEAEFTSQRIAESVIEALAEHVGRGLDEPILMPLGRRRLSLREVQRKYAALFERWIEKFGFRYAVKSVVAEAGELGWFADREAEKRDYRVVVLGHTHDHDFDEGGWLEKHQRIYANSGYWCPSGNDVAHFVEVEKRPKQLVVRVQQLDSQGKRHTVKFGSIKY